MRDLKYSLVVAIVILGFLLTATTIQAEPEIKEIILNPENPAPKDTITFTVTLESNEDIDGVRLILEECEEGLCYQDGFNKSMEKTNDGKYEVEITLKHQTAIEVKYRLKMKSGDVWYDSDLMELALSAHQNNGQDPGNSSPGFGVVTLLVMLSIALLLYKKKRFK